MEGYRHQLLEILKNCFPSNEKARSELEFTLQVIEDSAIGGLRHQVQSFGTSMIEDSSFLWGTHH